MAGEPGLQAERTALAWQRTGISGSAGGAVGLLAAAHDGRPWLVAVVAALATGCAVCAGVVARALSGASPWRRLVVTAGAALLLAGTGLVLATAAVVG